MWMYFRKDYVEKLGSHLFVMNAFPSLDKESSAPGFGKCFGLCLNQR